MLVSELIKMLETFPTDLKVVIAGEVGGLEEVESMREITICDNHSSQPSYFFGLIRKDAESGSTYRQSMQADRVKVR